MAEPLSRTGATAPVVKVREYKAPYEVVVRLNLYGDIFPSLEEVVDGESLRLAIACPEGCN